VEELWDADGLTSALEREFALQMDIAHKIEEDDSLTEAKISALVLDAVLDAYQVKTEAVGERVMRELEKGIMLRQLDSHWKEHIGALDYLRQGIGLRSFAQKNPKQEYKREAFEMFSDMLDRVKRDTITILSKIEIRRPEDVGAVGAPKPATESLSFQHAAPPGITRPAPGQTGGRLAVPPPEPGRLAQQDESAPLPFVREQPKVGRNQPCPCGSGKKYKQGHGLLN
jgi:preprotein translocase subunit SecA